MASTGLYGLPTPTPAQLNTTADKLFGKGSVVWADKNNDKQISADEISGRDAAKYVANATFTPEFERPYRAILEQIRQDSVAKELTYTFRNTITTNLSTALKAMPKSLHITDSEIALYKRGTAKLLEAAPLMQAVFERQAGFTPDMKKDVTNANDLELISRYGHPWCLADTSESCSALPSFAAHTSGMIASDIECDELGKTLTGPAGPFTAVVREEGAPKMGPATIALRHAAESFDEAYKTLTGSDSPFTDMVLKLSHLQTIPVATEFAAQMQPAAKILRDAAAIFTQIPREKVFAQYLAQLADDFGNTAVFPYTKSDGLWIAHKKSDSVLFARIGPDENGSLGSGDKCGAKAVFHFSIGLKNFESAELSTRFQSKLQGWEDKYAALVGDENIYKAQKVAVNLPDFLDILYQNGDDTGGPNGTNIGQTLPNWCGEDGTQSPCERRTMIYVNKTEHAYNKDLMNQYFLPLFHPSQRYLLAAGKMGLKGTVLHELAHNLGPQPGKKKPGTTSDYGSTLAKGNVTWKGTIEEFKAQMGALYFPSLEIVETRANAKAGKITAKELAAAENSYARDMADKIIWSLSHISRATHSGKFVGGSPYAKLSAVTIGYLADKGAMNFDAATQTWKMDFEKFPAAVESLTQKVVSKYARSDFDEVNSFMTYYMTGDGFKQLHVDRLQEVSGKKPSVILDYKIPDIKVN